MRARCCGGRGDAAKGPVDRGMSLCRVVVAMWPGRRDGVPCPRRLRMFISRRIDLLSWLLVMMCVVLEFAGAGRSGAGCMACRGL